MGQKYYLYYLETRKSLEMAMWDLLVTSTKTPLLDQQMRVRRCKPSLDEHIILWASFIIIRVTFASLALPSSFFLFLLFFRVCSLFPQQGSTLVKASMTYLFIMSLRTVQPNLHDEAETVKKRGVIQAKPYAIITRSTS